MLLSEQVRVLKKENNLIKDATKYSIQGGDQTSINAPEVSTTSTTYEEKKSFILSVSSGERVKIFTVQAQIKNAMGGATQTWMKVTAQPSGGSEVTLYEVGTNSSSYVTRSSSPNTVYEVAISVTVRFYLRTTNSSYAAYIQQAQIYWEKIVSWTALKDYGNITLTEDSIIILSYTFYSCRASNHRLLFGSLPVSGGALQSPDMATEYNTAVKGYVALPAGTYQVKAEATTNGKASVSDMVVGIISFADTQKANHATYSSAITLTLPTRKLAVGTVKNGNLNIHVFASTPNAQTNMDNVGENNTNSVKIYVDGAQKSWTARLSDNVSVASEFYGAAYGMLSIPASAGTQHTITISKSANTTVYVSVVFCPWIIPPVEYEPVSLDFPQGSTIYLTLEPLCGNPTKTVKLGKVRAISFGDSTDFYSTSSGVDILAWNYTFETVEVANAVLLVSGYGGCISIIGVDVR